MKHQRIRPSASSSGLPKLNLIMTDHEVHEVYEVLKKTEHTNTSTKKLMRVLDEHINTKDEPRGRPNRNIYNRTPEIEQE